MGASGTGTGTVGRVHLNQLCPPGILTSVSFTTDDTGLGLTDLHVNIVVCPVDGDYNVPNYSLVEGYASLDHPVAWNGFLSLDSNCMIYAECVGMRSGNLYLNYRRLTKTSIQSIGHYLKEAFNVITSKIN